MKKKKHVELERAFLILFRLALCSNLFSFLSFFFLFYLYLPTSAAQRNFITAESRFPHRAEKMAGRRRERKWKEEDEEEEEEEEENKMEAANGRKEIVEV